MNTCEIYNQRSKKLHCNIYIINAISRPLFIKKYNSNYYKLNGWTWKCSFIVVWNVFVEEYTLLIKLWFLLGFFNKNN